MPLEAAVAALEAVIDHLDMDSDTYEADRVALLSVGASTRMLRDSSYQHYPVQSPPMLRPQGACE